MLWTPIRPLFLLPGGRMLRRTAVVVLLVGAGSLLPAQTPRAVVIAGWVITEMCGWQMAQPGNEACVQDCYHKGRPLVLADAEHGTMYQIQNQAAALPHAGRLVAARTTLAPDLRSIRLERVH